MEKDNDKIWPFNTSRSLVASAIILIGLSIFFLLLHHCMSWPHANSVTVILIGIFAVTLLPIRLVLLDHINEHGTKIDIKKFEMRFSRLTQFVSPGLTVPTNIGIHGTAFYDSDIAKILAALRESKKSYAFAGDFALFNQAIKKSF